VTYNLKVPVARTVIPQAPSSLVNPAGSTDDIVMCLSCHMAHASRYENMLRFDYRYVVEGDSSKANGCLICHSSKGD
jgi:predicted CXXCH cytochrome family protein